MLTPGTFYTKQILHKGAFTPVTRMLLHQRHTSSHQRGFTPEHLLHLGHNCAFHKNISTPGGFCLTARSPYSRKPLLQKPFLPKSCYTIGIFYTKPLSIRRRCTAKHDLGLQNTNTLHRPAPPCTGATLDCKTQRHPG